MAKEKESFFKKMANVINSDYDEADDEIVENDLVEDEGDDSGKKTDWMEEENSEGQLTIDMHQNAKEIVIHAMVAGVAPEDLDIEINREMVEIKGRRTKERRAQTDDYFYQELYWGSFSRTVLLPQEIEVEEADASVHNGVLTITLPKIDKNKTQKLKVRK